MFESCRMFKSLLEISGSSQVSKRGKGVRSSRPHVTVVVDQTDEGTKLFEVGGFSHVEDGFNFLFPGFDAGGGEVMAKEVGFLDSPFTFLRVDCIAIVVKAGENFIEGGNMGFPVITEDCVSDAATS